jgi:nucleoside-diphosphate-sugar epimerase
MRAKRVLVTGATGFVGRALLRPLAAAGLEVHAVAHRSVPADGSATAWHQADLLDATAARQLVADLRPVILVHAAWYVAHGRFWTAPENADWLEASTALAAYFAEAGGRRVLGLGTCAEYAVTCTLGDGAPWPEHRPVLPATPYGRAKAALAARLAAMAERSGRLTCAWARLFHLFGPGEPPERLVPSVMLALREGREAACASGRPVRDFASTWFVGRALAALAVSGVTGPVNVASGQGRPIRDVVHAIARLAGRPDLVRLGRLPDRPGDPAYMVADTKRLAREVGFRERADLEADLAALLMTLPANGESSSGRSRKAEAKDGNEEAAEGHGQGDAECDHGPGGRQLRDAAFQLGDLDLDPA